MRVTEVSVRKIHLDSNFGQIFTEAGTWAESIRMDKACLGLEARK